MRLPKASSASVPDDRVQWDAGLARARPDLADELALQGLLVELALAGDDGARSAHARVEVERVEDPRRAGLERRAVDGPQPARQAAGGAGHRHAAGVLGERAASSSRRWARRSTISASAPFCGPNTSAQRSHGTWTSDSTTIFAPRRPPASSIASSAPGAAVGGGGAADRDEDHLRPARDRVGDQLAGAVGARGPGVALVLRDEREPGGRRHLDQRGAALLDEAVARLDLAAERVLDPRGDGLAAEVDEHRVERAVAAVGQRQEVGRHQPGALEPAADRAGDLGGAEGSLEGVGRDEDRALGDRHGGIVSRFAPCRRSTRSSRSTGTRSSSPIPARSTSRSRGGRRAIWPATTWNARTRSSTRSASARRCSSASRAGSRRR